MFKKRPNGGRFSCGGEARHRVNAIDSTAWPLGGRSSKEPWPTSAVSYKRWLGGGDPPQEDAQYDFKVLGAACGTKLVLCNDAVIPVLLSV